MKLTVLGNCGPYPSKGGATSGYLLSVDDKNYLLDMGSGVFSNLVKYIKPENLSAIIISHLHFDHISDLGVLSYYLATVKLENKIKLYLPDTNPFIEQVIKSGVFEVVFYNEGKLSLDTEIIATQMVHPVKSYALTFYGEKVFTYTGDTNFCPQVDKLFSVSNILLCDACFLKEEWSSNKPHMSINGICELGEKYQRKVILSHLNPKTDRKDYQSQCFGDYIITEICQEINL